MSLKRLLKKEDYEKLTKPVQEHYIEKDGSYLLDTDGDDETALMRAKEHEKTQRKTVEKELKELREQFQAVSEERDGMLAGSIPKADAEKLKSSLEAKLVKREKELLTQLQSHEANLTSMLVDNVATGLAAKISTSPTLLIPHIRARLKADLSDGRPTTKVIDRDGNVSAMTVADLEKEFLANKDFAPILTASKASGGGASGAASGAGGSGKGRQITREAFSAMSPTEQRAFAVTEKGIVTD